MSNDAPLGRVLREIEARDAPPSRDEVLEAFLDYVIELGFELYPAQEEAILELIERRHVILSTPTGSGKSLVAVALHFQAMLEGCVSFYTCPIKALVNEKFFDLCEIFGPENVGLLTGDASVNRDARIVCCTAEILANMAIRGDKIVDYVVMDEFHFYGDPDRGAAWQIPLISMPDTCFLLMSATLGDTTAIAESLDAYSGRPVARVSHGDRPVPLDFEYRDSVLQDTIQHLLDAGEAPIYLVNFTQRACAERAQALTSLNVCTREQKKAIAQELSGVRFDTPYGKELQRFLRAGIGVHHAGLLPRYRLLVEKLSQAGLLKVVSGTDSLGVGVNIPIRTVAFSQLSKYDGEKTRVLSAREFHQIAGRAGRKGFDDHGRVVVQAPEHVIENKRIAFKISKQPHLKNKLKKKSPPRGFVNWDQGTFDRLLRSPPEPLASRFDVSHGMLINALQSERDGAGGGYARVLELIGRSHGTPGNRKLLVRRAAQLFRSLREAGIVEVVAGRPAEVQVREGLQRNFSLHHTLSLYLVEMLGHLETEAEDRALEMLTLVESILEDPNAVLYRQVDKLKGELVARLKAEGVEYDERMAELEKVEHPKPKAEFLYGTFEAFAEHHPWIGGENIRPKSIAREMYERCLGFNEYITDLNMQRIEGVLLRYLSQCYQAAMQTVPEEYRDEGFEDVLFFLRTLLERTDSSILDEWERMMDGEIVRIQDRYEPLERAAPPLDPKTQFKAFSARIRSELHLLLGRLAARDWQGAAEAVRQTEDQEWDKKRFAADMAPYFEEYSSIVLTPQARLPDKTVLREEQPGQWSFQHRIVDPEDHQDWALIGEVDLTGEVDETRPLITLVRIGT